MEPLVIARSLQSLLDFYGFVERHAEAFETFGPALLVAGVDFLCEPADLQCVFSRHDEDAVAVGYDYIAGKNSNAGAVDGEVVGFGDEPSRTYAAGAVSVLAVDGDPGGLDDFVGIACAGIGYGADNTLFRPA